MEFCLLNDTQKNQYKDALLDILTQNDTAFVPPLSSRTGARSWTGSGGPPATFARSAGAAGDGWRS